LLAIGYVVCIEVGGHIAGAW